MLKIFLLCLQKEQAEKILTLLKQHYPHAKMILNFSNNFELLTAVMLSAQCTDVMVNKVTAKLFPKYKQVSQNAKVKSQKYKSKVKSFTPEIYEIINFAEVDITELEQDIRSTGFYKNKAKNLQAAAKMLLKKFGGVLPKTMADMITLPGVARKTANVVLGNAYGISEGIAVDTHVKRLSQRLGFSKHTDPDKIEQDLIKLFPQQDWFKTTYLLIEHGRKICDAKKPKCDECFLSKLCPSAFQFPKFKNKPHSSFWEATTSPESDPGQVVDARTGARMTGFEMSSSQYLSFLIEYLYARSTFFSYYPIYSYHRLRWRISAHDT